MKYLTFRTPAEKDIDALADLHFYIWNEFYTFVPQAFNDQHYTLQQCKDVQREMIDACLVAPEDHFALLAEDANGRLAGIGYIGRNIPTGYDLDIHGIDMELHRMYIRPEYRNQNLGTTLLSEGAKWAKKNGYRSAFVWSFDDNAYGRFYVKHGGKIVKQYRRDYAGTPLDLTVYGWDDFTDRFI